MCENRVSHLKKKLPREAQNNLAKNLFMEVFVILEGPCFLEPWRKNGFYEIFFFVFFLDPPVFAGKEKRCPIIFRSWPNVSFRTAPEEGGRRKLNEND